MAINRQRPALIHHSDRGSQYAAASHRKVLGAAGHDPSQAPEGKVGTMQRWKAVLALCKLNACARLATKPGRPPGTTCSPGFIPPSGKSPQNRQSASRLIRCPLSRGRVTARGPGNDGRPLGGRDLLGGVLAQAAAARPAGGQAGRLRRKRGRQGGGLQAPPRHLAALPRALHVHFMCTS
jgi:hypothetical protein